MPETLKIATRGSELALWQTDFVSKELKDCQVPSSKVILTTKGDTDHRPFQAMGGDGFFTKELERSMLMGDSDIAVHSAKDLPSMVHDELPWMAVGSREESGDILISKKPVTAEMALKIGSSSPRRQAQISGLFPMAQVVPLRGNVPTRIQKVASGEVDAIVLAKAGVKRLGLLQKLPSMGLVSVDLPFVGAPCQGIVGLQYVRTFKDKIELIQNSDLTRIAHAEKQILAFLGGGCHLPLGAQLRYADDNYRLQVFFQEGNSAFEGTFSEPGLGLALRRFMHAFIEPKGTQRVWLAQPLQHCLRPARLLAACGKVPVIWPLLEVAPSWNASDILRTVKDRESFGAVSFSSQFAVQIFMNEFGALFDVPAWLQKRVVLAVGDATAKKLQSYGVQDIHTGAKAHGRSLAEKIESLRIRGRILIPGQRMSMVTKHLRNVSGQIQPLGLYKVKPSHSVLTMTTPLAQPGDQIVLTSPSAAREFVLWCQRQPELKILKVWAFGPSTSKELSFLGVAHKTAPISGSWEELAKVL